MWTWWWRRRGAWQGACCAVCDAADDHSRRDRGDGCVADDSGGSGVFAGGAGVGDELVPDRVRRTASAGRADRGPDREQADLRRGARVVHRGVAPVRAGGECRGADRRPVPAGCRWRAGLGGDPGDDREPVPEAGRAGAGDGRLQLHGRERCVHRADSGRRDHPDHRLALGVLDQRPDRSDRAGVRSTAADLPARTRARERRRRTGCRPGNRRTVPGRLHDRPDRRAQRNADSHAPAGHCVDRVAGCCS